MRQWSVCLCGDSCSDVKWLHTVPQISPSVSYMHTSYISTPTLYIQNLQIQILYTWSWLWKSWRCVMGKELIGCVYCVLVMEMSWRSLYLSWLIRTITLRASVASAAAVTRSWTSPMTLTLPSTKLAFWPAKSTLTWTGRKVRVLRFWLVSECFQSEAIIWNIFNTWSMQHDFDTVIQ